eukprot:1046541-Rhodomonas_salina.3
MKRNVIQASRADSMIAASAIGERLEACTPPQAPAIPNSKKLRLLDYSIVVLRSLFVPNIIL